MIDHEQFESLKPEEQEKLFHQSSFREKSELILHAHYPDRLAQSLSQEELYLVMREMDLEERSEILRYANLPQLFFVSDMDCWKKDRIDPKGFVRWLETLKEADEKRLLAWLLEMDYETIVSCFKNVIEVLKPDWEYPSDELLGDRPYFTLDERYFIFVQEESLETLRRVMEVLFENHRGRYTAILEGILGEMDDVLEEDAFKNRQLRLADRGFPERETAREIYRPISEKEFRNFPPKNSPDTKPAAVRTGAPRYPVLWSSERLFLDDVFAVLKQEPAAVTEKIEEELAWLSNKVIACEGVDFSSEDLVRRGAERVRCFLNIGLEFLSGGNAAEACRLLKEKWLEIIFRYAVTRLVEPREHFSETLNKYWKDSKSKVLSFLNPPYEFIFRGLLQTVPQTYDEKAVDDTDRLRDFKNREELARAALAVDQIGSMLEWLARHKIVPSEGNSLFSVLATAFAFSVVKGKPAFAPLLKTEVKIFAERVFEKNGKLKILKKSGKELFTQKFFSPEEQTLLLPLWGFVFQEIEEELGGIDFSKDWDERFVSVIKIDGEKLKTGKPEKKARKKK